MAVKIQTITDNYALYNSDCVDTMSKLPKDSVHLSVYSPPFGGLYQYSSDVRDLSNCNNYQEFFKHYEYVVNEVCRITFNGRISAVHCSDIPSGNTGNDYLTDFSGDIIRLHEKCGFHFISRHTIWKEPLWVRNRTMTKNLSHKTIINDAAYGGVASADFLLIFRKKGINKIPIKHTDGLHYYSGGCPIPKEYLQFKNWKGDQKQNKFSHMIWRRYASSIWDDIRMERVLPYQNCKESDDEKHVHPLQLDVIDRVIQLRSNKDEIILSPFMGVGSEIFSAICAGRRGIGMELKTSYYRQSVANLKLAKYGIYEVDTNNYNLSDNEVN